jgi:hypothetical protein
MDYQERQAAGACGRVPRDFDDYYDLAKLLVFFLPTAIAVVWCLWYRSEIGVFIYLGLLVVFAAALWAVIVCYQSGKLEVVSDKLIPLREVQGELEELGYKAEFGTGYYARFVRKLSRIGPSIRIEILIYEGKILAHAWMTFGYRWKRMPFVTGRSQIQAVRNKLAASHSTTPTNSSPEMRKRLTGSVDGACVAPRRRLKWRKRK